MLQMLANVAHPRWLRTFVLDLEPEPKIVGPCAIDSSDDTRDTSCTALAFAVADGCSLKQQPTSVALELEVRSLGHPGQLRVRKDLKAQPSMKLVQVQLEPGCMELDIVARRQPRPELFSLGRWILLEPCVQQTAHSVERRVSNAVEKMPDWFLTSDGGIVAWTVRE